MSKKGKTEVKCKVCSGAVKEGDKAVGCDGPCGRWFHCQCVNMQIAEYEVLMKYNKLAMWMCVEDKVKLGVYKDNINFMADINNKFQDLVNKNEEVIKEISELKSKIVELQKSNDELVKHLAEKEAVINNVVKNDDNIAKTYASVVKNDPPLLIVPKIKQDAVSTLNVLKEKIDPVELKIVGVAKRTNGVVELISKDNDLANVKEAVEVNLGKDYEVRIAALIKPKVIVVGLEDEMDKDVVVDRIKIQNPNLESAEIKCVKVSKNNKRNCYNAILEVSSEAYKALLKMGKLRVGWVKCPVYDIIGIKRCFKCLGFNHNARECTNTQVCKKCKGDHDLKLCNNSEVTICTNCKKVNDNLGLNLDVSHDVMSRECMVYRRKVEIMQRKINY